MKFTGERYLPTEVGKIRIEHYHRYTAAKPAVNGKDVLDIACGEGYGAHMLARTAKSVLGVDISAEAISSAKKNYRSKNLSFLCDSAINLSCADDAFDVIVSFETIEHLEEQKEMLAEFRRVLRADGILIISSPNRPVYNEVSGKHNHYHVKELSFSEFDDLLKVEFGAVQHYGQKMLMGSVVQPLSKRQLSAKIFLDDGKNIKEGLPDEQNPTYFISVCAEDDALLASLEGSLLYPNDNDLVREYEGFAKWAQSQNKVLLEKNNHLTLIQADLDEREKQLFHYKGECERQLEACEQMTGVLEEKNNHLTLIQAELDEREKQLFHYKGECERQLEACEQMKGVLEEKNNTLAELKVTHIGVVEEIEGLQLTHTSQNDYIEELESHVEKKLEQIALLDAAIKAEQLSGETAAEEALQALEDLNIEHEKRLAERDSSFADQLQKSQDLLNSYEEKLAIAKSNLADQQQKLQDLGFEKDIRQKEIESLQSITDERNRHINLLSRNLEMALGQINKLETEAKEGAKHATSLEVRIAEKDTSIGHLTARLSNFEETFLKLGEEKKTLKGTVRKLHGTLNRRDLRLSTLKFELKGKRVEAQIALSKNTDLEDRLSRERAHSGHKYKMQANELETLHNQYDGVRQELLRTSQQSRDFEKQLRASEAHIQNLLASRSWRLTNSFRVVSRWAQSLKSQLKKYKLQGIKGLKDAYWRLPIDRQRKVNNRNRLQKLLPALFADTPSLPFNLPAPLTEPKTVPRLEEPVTGQAEPSTQDEKFAREAASIVLPYSDTPEVSVVIPIFGKVDYTLRCLESIAKNIPATSCEIIVVDDFSPDESYKILSQVKGLRLLQNNFNQGFIRSCNHGARESRGKYVYFLNNDTEVLPGWMDRLRETFDIFPNTGYAGSKLLYPDGRLQEAGGIIWQDGSAWNFGRLQDPSLPIYSYSREVDYVSGASIMIPKDLLSEIGGFDEHYLPAYCEDADLALKVRSMGYRVIYQSESMVVHYEGITSGTDETQGVKSYQVENSKKMYLRWKEHLEKHNPNGVDPGNEKDRQSNKRVLILDHCTPTPNEDAGSITVVNMMILLREMGFQVTFIPEDNLLYIPEDTTKLQKIGVEVLYGPYITSVEQHLQEEGSRYDLAFLFRPLTVTKYSEMLRKFAPQAKILFHTIDLHFLRMEREAKLLNKSSSTKLITDMRHSELTAIAASDASIVHSTAELDILTPIIDKQILHVFPLILHTPGTSVPFEKRKDFVFVGGYQHPPNVDAVHYFVSEVMPILRRKMPGVKFNVVGSNMPDSIKDLGSDDVIIHGFVKDLKPLLDKARVSIAPLRYGAGIKGKIGSAMAAGLPVVCTTLAAEGMSLTDGKDVLLADAPSDCARAINLLYHDKDLWQAMSVNGVKFAENAWGKTAAWNILNKILMSVGFEKTQLDLSASLRLH